MAEIIAVSIGASICCPISCIFGTKYLCNKYDLKYQSCCKGNGECYLFIGTVDLNEASESGASCSNRNSNSNKNTLSTGGNVTEINVNTGVIKSPLKQEIEMPPINNAITTEDEELICDLPMIFQSEELNKFTRNPKYIAYFRTNSKGRLTKVTSTFEKFSGKKRGFLIDPSLSTWDMINSFIHKDDRERLIRDWTDCVDNKKEMLIKFRMTPNSAKTFHTVCYSCPYNQSDVMEKNEFLGFRGGIVLIPSKRVYDKLDTNAIKNKYELARTQLVRDSTPSSIFYDVVNPITDDNDVKIENEIINNDNKQ